MEYTIEDFGYCEECESESVFDECARCGEEVCIHCHAEIGCDY